MMRFVISILALMIAAGSFQSCTKEREKNRVDLDQIQADDSNNYRYIFRDVIREEKRRNTRSKNEDFSGSKR
jgi:hypothetical protein